MILLVGCLGFFLGIFISDFFGLSDYGIIFGVVLASLGAVGYLLHPRRAYYRIAMMILCGAALGALRFQMANQVGPGDLARTNGADATVTGMVVRERSVRGYSREYVVRSDLRDGIPAHGQFLLIVSRGTAFAYGDRVRVRCSFESVDLRLRAEGMVSTCRFPDAVARLGNGGSPVVRAALALKGMFISAWTSALPPDSAALAAGLFFGDLQLSPERLAEFRAAGVSHITAVSGYNVSLILMYVFMFFGFVGCSRRVGLILSGMLLALFIFAAGPTPSLLRAALMGTLPFAANALGRPLLALRSLIVVAAFLLALNPFLYHNVGFLLSFAATFGMIQVAPAVLTALPGRKSPYPVVETIRALASQTLAAVVMTLPIVLASFGSISLVAPIANLFVLFAVPGAMLMSFLLAVASPLLPAVLLAPFTLAAHILLVYLLRAVSLFAGLPLAQVSVGVISPLAAAILYAAIALFVFELRRPKPHRS